MRISTKCSIALHLLVLLGVFREQKLTSEILAMSIGCGFRQGNNVQVHIKQIINDYHALNQTEREFQE